MELTFTQEESFASVHFTSHWRDCKKKDDKETNIFSSSYYYFLFVQQALRVCFIAIFIALIVIHIIQRYQILFFISYRFHCHTTHYCPTLCRYAAWTLSIFIYFNNKTHIYSSYHVATTDGRPKTHLKSDHFPLKSKSLS